MTNVTEGLMGADSAGITYPGINSCLTMTCLGGLGIVGVHCVLFLGEKQRNVDALVAGLQHYVKTSSMLFVAGNIELWNQSLGHPGGGISALYSSVDAIVSALTGTGNTRCRVVRVETDPHGNGGTVDIVFNLTARTCSVFRVTGGARAPTAESTTAFPV